METLVSLAIEYAKGNLSPEQVWDRSRALEKPVFHSDVDGGWYEGEEDNTFMAVQALVGHEMDWDTYAVLNDYFYNKISEDNERKRNEGREASQQQPPQLGQQME